MTGPAKYTKQQTYDKCQTIVAEMTEFYKNQR